MPRILPWKRRERALFQNPTPADSSPVRNVKQEEARHAQDEADSVPSSDTVSATKKTLKRPRRSASTSTSTSPVPQPPQETLMIDGIDGDDRYRMVEDEFLTTAQQFTAHLHAAEYKRLKDASELENAQMIKNISRPVVGQVTNLVKIKQERKALIQKQRLATRKLRRDENGDDSTDDHKSSWQKLSLHGLMESPGKEAERLDSLPSALPVTRAAAGFNRMPSDVSLSRPKPRSSPDTTRHHMRESEDRVGDTSSHGLAHRISQPALSSSSTATKDPQTCQPKATEKSTVSDNEDMDIIARLKQRQEERRRNRGQRKSITSKSKLYSGDILPDFL
ncbi:hypothetical protein FHL15_009005 [Xylaria flabelliformis]|uniref:Uncharacterized protein n=1 Tax=Xylaria flabelliformis TaxID=2512241 RepID=A0A553HQ61_9PEZI|nr:hypothetical protein FHL15_009005 [Xylaria flabelliformis]